MKIFVFYPDTYLRCCNGTTLFVGLHNGNYILERTNSLAIEEKHPWFEITNDSLLLAERCSSKGLGYILEYTTLPYIPQKTLHVISSVKRTSELMKFAEGYHSKDLLREIHILAHNTTYQAPSDIVYSQIKYPVLGESADLPQRFVNDLVKSHIRSIIISGDIDSYLTSCLNPFVESDKNITIRTHGVYKNLTNAMALLSDFPNVTIDILLDSIELLPNMKHIVKEKWVDRILVSFIVKDTYELNKFIQFPCKSKFFIPILYDIKLQQSIVNEILLEADDIIGTSCSPMEISKKQMIHTNNYGSLLIDSNGNVFDCLRFIGSIYKEDIYELLNKNLHNPDSLWYMTRRKRKVCCNCVFADICPPPSVYELQGVIPYACNNTFLESISRL